MELVQEVREAAHATANAEFAAWVEDAGGLDLAPITLAGGVQAWVASPRSARPPVGFLVVRSARGLEITTGDAAATGRVLAGVSVSDTDLPALCFELLRSRARPMSLAGTPPPSLARDASGVVSLVFQVSRGNLAPERWSLRLDGAQLDWSREKVSP